MLGNLDLIIGSIEFIIKDFTSSVNSRSTVIIVTAAVSIVISALMLIIIVVVFKHLRKCCHFDSSNKKSHSNEAVNMYASPAYGSHQVFTELGLDHLYEPISHKLREKMLQDAAPHNDIDKMKSSRAADQAVTKGNIGTQHVVTVTNPRLTQPINEQLTEQFQKVHLVSSKNIPGTKVVQPHNDGSSPLHSDYENEDDGPADHLQIFNNKVDQSHLKFSGNVTLV